MYRALPGQHAPGLAPGPILALPRRVAERPAGDPCVHGPDGAMPTHGAVGMRSRNVNRRRPFYGETLGRADCQPPLRRHTRVRDERDRPTMSNVIITLAHHLSGEDAEKLGLPNEDLNPLTEVVVTDDVARGLIGAGYAAVETEQPQQVAKALRRHAPKDHPVGVYQAPQEARGEDDGETADTEPKTNAAPGPSGTQAAAKRGK